MMRIFVMLALLFVVPTHAAPIAKAGDDNVVVTLTDEPCALPAVSNIHEGCYAVGRGLAMFYFADRTVVAIPVQAFQRVTGV